MAKDGYPYIIIPLVLALVCLALDYLFAGNPYAAIPLFLVQPFSFRSSFHGLFLSRPASSSSGRSEHYRFPCSKGRDACGSAHARLRRFADSGQYFSLSAGRAYQSRAHRRKDYRDDLYQREISDGDEKEESALSTKQNSLTIEGERITLVCKQIAGVLARLDRALEDGRGRIGLGRAFRSYQIQLAHRDYSPRRRRQVSVPRRRSARAAARLSSGGLPDEQCDKSGTGRKTANRLLTLSGAVSKRV